MGMCVRAGVLCVRVCVLCVCVACVRVCSECVHMGMYVPTCVLLQRGVMDPPNGHAFQTV